MNLINYEPHTYDDPSFPIIFHLDYVKLNARFLTHWHESVEILYVIDGKISVLSGTQNVYAKQGDLIIINSNNIHKIQSLENLSKYYCLIVEKRMCEEFGLCIQDVEFITLVTDDKVNLKFNEIISEFKEKNSFFKSAVKSDIIKLLIYLYRHYTKAKPILADKIEDIKVEIIKNSIKYIQANFHKNISTKDIAQEAGLSKSYFCRIFKKTTGYTVVFYINMLRCSNAKNLIQSGLYQINEVALLCGFDNLSYFSKTYKQHIGCLPSQNTKLKNPDNSKTDIQVFLFD